MESVIIVGAGIMQIPAILTAKDMGFHVVATDMNPKAEGFAYADQSVVLNTKDIQGHIKFAVENQKKLNIVGVFAGADVARTVAGITNALGLPGISEETALVSNNKWLMKQRWMKDGVPTPKAMEVKSFSEAKAAVAEIGLPCMVKAIDNAASRGTRKLEEMVDLEEAFEDACKNSTMGTAIIEEFVTGTEQSVETVAFEGKQYRFGIVDRHYDMLPLPIETGHTNPTRLPKEIQEEIYKVVKMASDSLGITWGPAKADMILTWKGPMILEMPARLSGGFHSQYTTPLSSGMDPIRFVLSMATGRGLDIEAHKAKFDHVAVCKAIFPGPGRVVSISGVEEAENIPGVDKIFMIAKVGDVIRPYSNCADRVCYVIAHGKDFDEADHIFNSVNETVKIKTI